MNNNILSSIALFSELYKQEKDVFFIIGEFIKSTIKISGKIQFSDIDMKNMLKSNFNIDIPLSLVNYILRQKLQEDIAPIKRQKNSYQTKDIAKINGEEFRRSHGELEQVYQGMFDAVYTYVKTVDLENADGRDFIKQDFINYILKHGNPKLSDLYAAFVISNECHPGFRDSLNMVTEGLVVYSGIQYVSPDEMSKIGRWTTPLTIYLDTEQIFNFAGYNDEYWQAIFNELFELTREINQIAGKRLISFMYFEETHKEIDDFFNTAENIILGKKQLIAGKVAMTNIVNKCKDVFDVKAKKTSLLQQLQNSGILYDDTTQIKPLWNVGQIDTLKLIETESRSKNIKYDEDEAVRYLNIFSKINTLRNGDNDVSFDKCKYIFLSADGLVRYLSALNEVKDDARTRFSTDIDFVTSKLWFAMQKSFNSSSTPITFDIISRSQLVLKSHYNDVITHRYAELVKKELSDEAKLDIYQDLYCKGAIKAKDIIFDSLPEIISFLRTPNIDTLLQEKSIQRQKLQEAERIKYENEKLIKEKSAVECENMRIKESNATLCSQTAKTDRENRTLKNVPIKKDIRFYSRIKNIAIYCIIYLIIAVLIYLTNRWRAESDTSIALVGFILSCISIFAPFIGRVRSRLLSKVKKNGILKFKSKMYK
ncbi:MAG: hypothetical protein SNJ29_08625 [Rikenellaceae bacterium]